MDDLDRDPALASLPPARLLDNPFFVLELAPDCARAEVERAGQKLLAMLELGLRGADRYPTAFGPQPRDPAKVREAMAELRDPQRRLGHELWALAAADEPSPSQTPGPNPDRAPEDPQTGFAAALPVLGWGWR